MPLQVTDNSVYVAFIPGCHIVKPVLTNIPVSHFVGSFVTVGQNILVKYLYVIWVLWQHEPNMKL